MENRSNLKFVLFLFVQCVMFSGRRAMLNLFEDEVCQKGDRNTDDSVCKLAQKCSTLEQDIRRQKFPPICSFVGHSPVVCCSPISKNTVHSPPYIATAKPFVRSYTAAEMCRQYSKLVFTTIKNPLRELLGQMSEPEYVTVKDCFDVLPLIVGGVTAFPKEFPHMALLGYGNRRGDNKTWGCGGSLISNRWILSAAHCANNTGRIASWVRLGNVNIQTDKAEPDDYDIVERVVHPHYNPSYIYNDIALFRLGRDVKFSPYVRPICLNADQSLAFDEAKVAGWGRTSPGGPTSPDLLRTHVKPISINRCKQKYPPSSNPRINLGILEDSMICAGDIYDGNDTCAGDSGGPLQIDYANVSCVYTLIGITSFGKYCGSKDTPGVYTKVSNYIPWIEQTVWPKN